LGPDTRSYKGVLSEIRGGWYGPLAQTERAVLACLVSFSISTEIKVEKEEIYARHGFAFWLTRLI
jgi:hypothetical protein